MNGYGVSVLPTLYESLIYLRLKDRPRFIWIDVWCIDLADNQEESVQGFRMSLIYFKALKIIAYLGETYLCCGSALQLLEDVHFNMNYADLCHKSFKHLLLSFRLLLEAPWFPRTWVRQGVFMAGSLE